MLFFIFLVNVFFFIFWVVVFLWNMLGFIVIVCFLFGCIVLLMRGIVMRKIIIGMRVYGENNVFVIGIVFLIFLVVVLINVLLFVVNVRGIEVERLVC